MTFPGQAHLFGMPVLTQACHLLECIARLLSMLEQSRPEPYAAQSSPLATSHTGLLSPGGVPREPKDLNSLLYLKFTSN